MGIIEYLFNQDSSNEEAPACLSSYRQAAEIICMCWNNLDISMIEPYLDENVTWSGGTPHRIIHGKEDYLKMMRKVFNRTGRFFSSSGLNIFGLLHTI